jgi:hypothetical protein
VQQVKPGVAACRHDRTPAWPVWKIGHPISDYFSVRDGKIVSLTVIRNQPSPY